MIRKTILFVLLTVCMSTAGASAQDWKSLINDIAKTAVGDMATSELSIIGQWNYKGAACQFESDDLLAQAGGTAVTGKINTELENIYSKIGFDHVEITFNSDDTYSLAMGKITSKGTYTFDNENKKISMKTKMGITVNANVVTLGNSMSLMFNADKLMSAIQSLTGLISNTKSNASYLADLFKNYDGLKVGFELTK